MVFRHCLFLAAILIGTITARRRMRYSPTPACFPIPAFSPTPACSPIPACCQKPACCSNLEELLPVCIKTCFDVIDDDDEFELYTPFCKQRGCNSCDCQLVPPPLPYRCNTCNDLLMPPPLAAELPCRCSSRNDQLILPPLAAELPSGLGYFPSALPMVSKYYQPSMSCLTTGAYLPVTTPCDCLTLAAPVSPEWAPLVRSVVL